MVTGETGWLLELGGLFVLELVRFCIAALAIAQATHTFLSPVQGVGIMATVLCAFSRCKHWGRINAIIVLNPDFGRTNKSVKALVSSYYSGVNNHPNWPWDNNKSYLICTFMTPLPGSDSVCLQTSGPRDCGMTSSQCVEIPVQKWSPSPSTSLANPTIDPRLVTHPVEFRHGNIFWRHFFLTIIFILKKSAISMSFSMLENC